MAKPNGYVLWQGPSLLDGAPIVMIGTGYEKASANVKTGGMIQTWILRADMAPQAALQSGNDASICGDCVLRGVHGKERGCYVNIGQAPRAVFDGFQRGIYPNGRDRLGELHAERVVRLGAYGDPGAVPRDVLEGIVASATSWTGYTHQWQTAELQSLCMASVETYEQSQEAQRRGYRTFRTLSHEGFRIPGKEILCPASAEAGHKTTCEKCTLCDGAHVVPLGRRDGDHLADRRKSIAIVVHGTGRKWAGMEVANV